MMTGKHGVLLDAVLKRITTTQSIGRTSAKSWLALKSVLQRETLRGTFSVTCGEIHAHDRGTTSKRYACGNWRRWAAGMALASESEL
jgi:hypothetical protein